jgi:hypothetical protein
VEEYKQVKIVPRESSIAGSIDGVYDSPYNSATIQVTADKGPLVAVNVSLIGDFSEVKLEGDFIAYLEKFNGGSGWIQIPYIESGETKTLQVSFESQTPPGYVVQITGYDLSGNVYSLAESRAKPILTNITCNVEKVPIEAGDQITVSGQIDPQIQGAELWVNISNPIGETILLTLNTDADGQYSQNYLVETVGQWKVKVGYSGDSAYYRSETETMFQVNRATAFYSIKNIIIILCVLSVFWIIYARKRV